VLGPTTVALMLLPVVLGVVISLFLTRRASGDWRVSGVWLLLVALPIAIVSDRERSSVADPALVNRIEAVLLCVVAACFVWLNRRHAVTTRAASWLVAVGVWLNALGVVAYGAMPVLRSAAAVADNPFTSSHPSPGYVRSDDLGWFGIVIGDFIPIPHFLKVLSIGDLLLFAGCVLLLSLFLARLWQGEPHRMGSDEPRTREGVTHG
jgi:hypothetical protein